MAVRGCNALTAACVRLFQLFYSTGRQGETDVSLVSSFISSGSKVLLDLTDREKYVAYFQRFKEVTCASVDVRFCFICLFVYRGDTALHKAATEKLHAVCRLLVEAGASLKKTNFQVFIVNDVTHTLRHTHAHTLSQEKCLR